MQSCAHWLSWRVGRGEGSYSKVRAIARVATPHTEETLLVYAQHAPAAQLEKICQKLRAVNRAAEGRESGKRHDPEERYVQVRQMDDGMACVRAVLRPEEAAMLLQVIQVASRACSETPDPKRPPNRADGLMAVIQGYARGDAPERTPIELIVTVPASGERARTALSSPSRGSAEPRDEEPGVLGEPASQGASLDAPSLPLELPELPQLAELPNGDCVCAEAAQRLACDAGSWRSRGTSAANLSP